MKHSLDLVDITTHTYECSNCGKRGLRHEFIGKCTGSNIDTGSYGKVVTIFGDPLSEISRKIIEQDGPIDAA